MSDNHQTMLGRVREHSEHIKLLLALVAGIWALILFYNEQQQERVRVSLSYIEQYRSTEMMERYITVVSPWITPDGLNTLMVSDVRPIEKINLRLIEEQQLEDEIYHLFYFYADIALCAKTGLCDKESLCTYFKAEVDAFTMWYFPYLTRLHQAWEAPYFEVREFVNSCP